MRLAGLFFLFLKSKNMSTKQIQASLIRQESGPIYMMCWLLHKHGISNDVIIDYLNHLADEEGPALLNKPTDELIDLVHQFLYQYSFYP